MTMRIEVAVDADKPTKTKGDLLEKLAESFLRALSYDVDTQVRLTATELDLLCQHRVNTRRVYVECKAYRDPLSANVLKNLLGTVTFKNYDEGWLVSAGPLGKDARGFREEWERKSAPERQRLSIYTPRRLVEALVAARVLKEPPEELASMQVGSARLGEWTLLVTEYGTYWCVTVIRGGIPTEVATFDAPTGGSVSDQTLLKRLRATDTSLRHLDFVPALVPTDVKATDKERPLAQVVQVQHGESWSDYRPARPQDFIGRKQAQDIVLRFLDSGVDPVSRTG